jgi:hypothetical protein
MIKESERVKQNTEQFALTLNEMNPLKEILRLQGMGFTDNDLKKILERFEKEETILAKSGQRIADPFRKFIRHQCGLKEDYTQLTFEEKAAEAGKKIIRDFMIAREEIRTRNPVDYFLDRALDPLDPMGVVYKLILGKMGAKIDEQTKAITLTPELNQILQGKRKDIDMEGPNQAVKLPVFGGYTVDNRLSEFRKAEPGKAPEFIPFDSPKGQTLTKGMMKGKELPFDKVEFDIMAFEHFRNDSLSARITDVQLNKLNSSVEFTLQANGDKFSLKINDMYAKQFSVGDHILINETDKGIKISVIDRIIQPSLKR